MTLLNLTLPGELLDRLAARAMAATTLAELAFSLANDAYPLPDSGRRWYSMPQAVKSR